VKATSEQCNLTKPFVAGAKLKHSNNFYNGFMPDTLVLPTWKGEK